MWSLPSSHLILPCFRQYIFLSSFYHLFLIPSFYLSIRSSLCSFLILPFFPPNILLFSYPPSLYSSFHQPILPSFYLSTTHLYFPSSLLPSSFPNSIHLLLTSFYSLILPNTIRASSFSPSILSSSFLLGTFFSPPCSFGLPSAAPFWVLPILLA